MKAVITAVLLALIGGLIGWWLNHKILLQHRDQAFAYNNQAWTLVSNPDPSLRSGPQAVQLAEKACLLTKYSVPACVGTLGAAYAQAGRFSDAISMAEKARALAAKKDDPTRAGDINKELEALYREHKTYGDIVDLQIPVDTAPFVQMYYYTQHENFIREATNEQVNLLFLGDSITEHWRYQGSNIWNQYYAPRHAANFAIGGERTSGVLWQVQHGELKNLKPKVIVLLIGTNNTGTDGPYVIASDIKALVEEIRSSCPGSKVLLLGILPRNRTSDTPAQMESIQNVNAAIAGMDDGKMIRFLNISGRFLGTDGKVSATLMPDFLHPSEMGYQVFAESMEPTLAQMLKN